MEENIQKYHPLGSKTLIMLIFERSYILFILVPILVISLFALTYVPSAYIEIAIGVFFAYLAILMLVVLLVFFLGWLEYYRYWIFVSDKDIKVQRGLFATEEVGIPFRRIKDVKIERSIINQILGVSDIVITTLGFEAGDSHEEDEVVLPAVDKKIAIDIQSTILKKAQVEQINVVAGQKIF